MSAGRVGTLGREEPGFSFVLGEEPSSDVLPRWARREESIEEANGVAVTRITRRSPDALLTVIQDVAAFRESPAREWVLHFRNDGERDAPILRDVLSLDLEIGVPPYGSWVGPALEGMGLATSESPVVHCSRAASKTWPTDIFDFALHHVPLHIGESVRLANPRGGKPSDLPYANLQMGPAGLILGVGWCGRWAIDISRIGLDTIRLKAGMEGMNLSLRPGEQVRTPRILLFPWQGDLADGHNAFRRFVLEHHAPRHDGRPVQAPVSCPTWGGMKTENHLRLIEAIRSHALPYDLYHVDAGWFGEAHEAPEIYGDDNDWYYHAGNWQCNPRAHPDGLRPVSDAAHAAGMKFMLWFEPERAVEGAPVTREHPEWLFPLVDESAPGGRTVRSHCLDFGHPEARRWITDVMSERITTLGVDVFRHDCNFGLARFWTHAEPADRRGMNEIRYVEGLYAFWDELRARHPGLVFDIMQRKDLEAVSRGLDLFGSDSPLIAADPIGGQVGGHGHLHWIPLAGFGHTPGQGSPYGIRSHLGASLEFPVFNFKKELAAPVDHPWALHAALMEQYRRARPYFYGDYYPLLDASTSPRDWFAYQLHRPDLGEGVIVAFRRPQSPFTAARFRLRGLVASATYAMEDADAGTLDRVRGDLLLGEGLCIRLDQAPSSRIVFYHTG